MAKENITQGDVMRLIRHCIEQEEIIKKKLDSLQDKTVDILQITLMGAKGMDGEVPNGKDGLGTNEDYVKFFRDIVLPKSKYGILNVMEKHSHNTFIGSKNGLYCGTDEFLKWINQALKTDFFEVDKPTEMKKIPQERTVLEGEDESVNYCCTFLTPR